MKTGLTDEQLEEIRKITGNFPSVEMIRLFGSRAKGTFSNASDVDLALFGKDVTLKDQIRISSLLNESRSMLKYDVIRYSTIENEKLIEHIKKYGLVIYKRDNVTISDMKIEKT